MSKRVAKRPQAPRLNAGEAPVVTIQIHPAVWQRALAAADGDARRIEVLDPNRVKIHNNADWR